MSALPPTKTEVRTWAFGALTDQAAEWTRAEETVTTEYGTINLQLADSPGFWRGAAGDAMRVKSEEAKTSLSKVVEAFGHAATSTSSIVHLLGFAKSAAVNAIQAAEDERYTVAEDGTVSYATEVIAWLAGGEGKSLEVAKAALDQGQRQHEAAIKSALQAAGDAAASAGEAIIKVFADVPIPPNAELENILNSYQVNKDQQGMTTWPSDDFMKWINRVKPGEDIQVKEVTVSEAAMLNKLSAWEQYRVYMISEEASSRAEQLFPSADNNYQDNHADAFRHAYWNAMLTEEFGEEWTKEYTTKHEGREDNRSTREAMDLYNNELGRRIATENPGGSMSQKIIDAFNNGDGVLIDKDGNLARPKEVRFGEAADSEMVDDANVLPGSLIPNNKPSTG
ncbi:DUF6973 domain-containing protein [Nocardia noduli]|uniref:DUF6973 domain-containing protein n=1 Tax=Nocardia noduli TaxID=2815722 RepID=UPI001C21081A|nr:hypothetical protein [Nocardia noduli]